MKTVFSDKTILNAITFPKKTPDTAGISTDWTGSFKFDLPKCSHSDIFRRISDLKNLISQLKQTYISFKYHFCFLIISST